MKCPNCGDSIPNNSCKCKRCGYVCKSLVIESFTKEDDGGKEQKIETKHIDPKNVKMGKQNSGGSIFESLFGGLFGGGISDIFGSLFGVEEDDDEDGYNDDEPRYYDDFGNSMPYDVFDRDFVEIKKVEFVEEADSNSEKDENSDAKNKKNKKDKKR